MNNLEKMTRPQLIEAAEAAGLTVSGKPTKQQLINLILENSEKEDDKNTVHENEIEPEQKAEEDAPAKEEKEAPEDVPARPTPPAAAMPYQIKKRTDRRRRSRRASLAPPVTVHVAPEVITVDGTNKFKKTYSQEELLLQELAASKDPNTKMVLTGKIMGSSTVELKGEIIPLVKVLYMDHIISILPQKFFPDYDKFAKEPGKIKNKIEARKNTMCSFIMDYIDPEYPYDPRAFALGSRLKAMEKEKNKMWMARIEKRDEDGRRLFFLRPGALVQDAKIVEVTRSGLFVEVFGVESFISNKDLFWSRKNDAREEFQAGMKIPIMLKTVEREIKNGSVKASFTASHILTMEDPRPKYFQTYDKNDSLFGTVTGSLIGHDKSGNQTLNYYVNVQDQIAVLCSLSKNMKTRPAQGDLVDIIITEKYADTLQFVGVITRVR
ncbi:S1 RNA-binding domain-containing protein [Anaerovoracaceae bacterium 42-11]